MAKSKKEVDIKSINAVPPISYTGSKKTEEERQASRRQGQIRFNEYRRRKYGLGDLRDIKTKEYNYDEDGNIIRDKGENIYKNISKGRFGKGKMEEEEWKDAILEAIEKTPLPIDSINNREFMAFRQKRIETGIDESAELFDKEIDKWPLF